MVVIVEINQLTKLQMPRERGCLGGHAFHQVAVRHNRIDIMIDDREILLVELRGEVRGAHRDADAVSKSLSQGTGRNLHTRSQNVLGMSGGLRAPLTKILN